MDIGNLPQHFLDDFTLYVKNGHTPNTDELRAFLAGHGLVWSWSDDRGVAAPLQYSASGTGEVSVDGVKVPRENARITATMCGAGQYISITVRSNRRPGGILRDWIAEHERFPPHEYHLNDGVETLLRFFGRRQDVASTVNQALKRALISRPGLILVTGRTSCMKSAIARSILETCLNDQYQAWQNAPDSLTKPHLITYEDPIEKYLFKPFTYPSAQCLGTNTDGILYSPGVNYTPRQKGLDVSGLEQATYDALRQTPTVFFVGEVRSKEDFKTLINFAGTGHAVIATAHASSLVESFSKLLKAASAHTPAQRRDLISCVSAIIHLRTEDLSIGDNDWLRAVIPACWLSSASAQAGFVATGLGSVVSRYSDPASNRAPLEGTLGRVYFAKKVALLRKMGLNLQGPPQTALTEECKAKSDRGNQGATGSEGYLDSELKSAPQAETLNLMREQFLNHKQTLIEKATSWDIEGV